MAFTGIKDDTLEMQTHKRTAPQDNLQGGIKLIKC